MEGHDLADPFVNARFPALEGDRAVVQRQAVEARPVLARKALEPVESALFVEGGEIGFEREGRVEDSRAAARSDEHTSELQSLMLNSYAVFCLKQQIICNNAYLFVTFIMQRVSNPVSFCVGIVGIKSM